MGVPLKNFAISPLIAGYSAADTILGVMSGDKFPAIASVADRYKLVYWNSSDYPSPADDPDAEIIEATARTGGTFTTIRGVDGTTAKDHNVIGKTYSLALNSIASLLWSLQVFDVRSFGVTVFDGSVVYTTQIQDAIDTAAASTARSKIVQLPAGTFVVDDPNSDARCLVPKPGVHVRGAGMGQTIIKLKTGTAPDQGNSPRVFSVDAACPNFTLSHLTIDGNKAGNPLGSDDQKHGFMNFSGATYDLLIENVEFKNCDGDGVFIFSLSERVRIRRCVFRDNDRIGANITGCSNSHIDRNHCIGNGSWGIKGEIDLSSPVGTRSGISITRNTITNSANGIAFTGDGVSLFEDCEITGNKLSTLTGFGIVSQGGVRGITIAKNKIKAATNYGILIGLDAQDCFVFGNRVTGMLASSPPSNAGCIVVGGQSGTVGCKDISIVDNKCMGGAVRGFVVSATGGGSPVASIGVQLIGNTADGTAMTAIEAGDVDGLLLHGNSMINMATNCIFLRHYTLLGVRGCRILGNNFQTTVINIAIEAFDFAVTDLVLDGNIFALTGTRMTNPDRIGGVFIRGENVNFDNALVAGDFALSAGWGSGASVSAITGADRAARFTVTAGTSPSANPTISFTYKNGSWGARSPQVMSARGGGSQPTVPLTHSTTATVLTLTFQGTPVAAETYIINFMAQSETR